MSSNTFLSLLGSIPQFRNKQSIDICFHNYTSPLSGKFRTDGIQIQYLVNFINNSERTSRQFLQRHQIQNSRNTFFSSALMKLCEYMQTILGTKLHFNFNSVFFIVFLALYRYIKEDIEYNFQCLQRRTSFINPEGLSQTFTFDLE